MSCLVDRASSKIAFISSAEGGVDIEKVAKNNPEKIVTIKMNLSKSVSDENIKKITQPFVLSGKSQKQTFDLIQSIYKILIKKDASLIEINPLILTEDDNILCLDAKINFDDNALYRHPDIVSLKDPNEEDPIETEAKKHELIIYFYPTIWFYHLKIPKEEKPPQDQNLIPAPFFVSAHTLCFLLFRVLQALVLQQGFMKIFLI